ncbi:MAG: NADH-quinone oxidoreductase subunit N [Candidatus Micrarchaeia archaeon]
MIAIYVYAALLALLAGSSFIFIKKESKKQGFAVSVAIMLALEAISVYSFSLLKMGQAQNSLAFGFLVLSPFSSFMLSVFMFVAVLVMLLAYRYSSNYPVFLFLFSISIVGMSIVIMSYSFISIIIGMELLSLPTMLLILSSGRQHAESSIKFFIMSSIAIGLLAFSIALILPYDGSLTVGVMPYSFNYQIGLAMLLFAVALGIEASIFPFNLWIPDVYQGSPDYITPMLASINKKIAFVVLLEVFFISMFTFSKEFSPLWALLSILTMFFGNLVALVQDNVKRMLAYSSISQAGYIAIGIAAATSAGFTASVFQIIAHMFMILVAFTSVLILSKHGINNVKEYSGLASKNQFIAFSLTISFLSMIGVPPLMGFFGKFLLFSSAISSNLFYLAFFGIINSIISIYYYFRVIMAMYSPSLQKYKHIYVSKEASIVLSVSTSIIILLGIFPQIILYPIEFIANNL